MKIITKQYKIYSELNKKIVLISDIHYSNRNDINTLNNILEKIKSIKPDYICIPGDIIDKSKIDDESLFIDWLKKLSSISHVIVSIGNHEYYIDKHNEVFGLNKDFYNKLNKINNLYVLDNKNKVFDNINFIGLNLPIDCYFKPNIDKFNRFFNNISIEKDKFNILLCHTPRYFNKSVLDNKKIDLILCGHMHGGVVPNFLRPIIKHMGFISPSKTLFPKNTYGNIKICNTNLIISRGCKVLTKPNIFSPEVVVIELTKF